MGSGRLGVRGEHHPDWAERLKQAAGAGNLVDSFAQTWLRNRIQDHPDEVRAAFGKLYAAGSL